MRPAVVAGVLLLLGFAAAWRPEDHVLTNEWHVKLRGDHSQAAARRVARDTGFQMVRRFRDHPDQFVFRHEALPAADRAGRMRRSAEPHHLKLVSHPSVTHAAQQSGFRRSKRGFKHNVVNMQKKGLPNTRKISRIQSPLPNDPLFSKEWYIHNTGQAEGTKGLDLNVLTAWAEGYTGKGVTTAIMDDGIDYLHPDLAMNYNAQNSYDFSSNDPYPYPRYTDDWFNSHGTRCAGEISSIRDNKICGVGVAYNSRVAGLRMLDQPFMTDLIEASAMSHDRDQIHIYSASWGPTDDGKTVDGPRNETIKSLVDGVNKGRGGLGNIYVWASGDGGPDDDCNCDGYAASMWTISINSATNDGQTASYDESCSSTLASTFSNGKAWFTPDAGVATVDLYGNCTLYHSGTSAAAPEAAGVFALALEANPKLTWRDVQHLTVLTSKRNHLYDGAGLHNWTINGAGLEFNHLFGYGVLDAGDIVKMAKLWKTVPERFHCVAGKMKPRRHFNVSQALVLTIDTDACERDAKTRINFLEHAQAFVTLRGSRRGDVTMFLTSPMGTTSMILSKRPKDDDSQRGFTKWPFMTTHAWGEKPKGKWQLTVTFDTEDPLAHGVLYEWVLVLHGTQSPPYKDLPAELDRVNPKLAIVKRQHEKFGRA